MGERAIDPALVVRRTSAFKRALAAAGVEVRQLSELSGLKHSTLRGYAIGRSKISDKVAEILAATTGVSKEV